MLLSKLTPAETLLIRDGDEVSVKELLKYTFMDLLVKQVLMTEDVERQLNMRDPVRIYKYVSPGKNFSQYTSLPHELPFLLPFRRNSDNRLLFKNCVQVGYENVESKRALHKAIRLLPSLHNAFSASLLEKVFGEFSYTDRGLELKRQVEEEIKQLERELTVLMVNDREKAMEKLKPIGGNVFLLHALNFTVLREIDEAFSKELTRQGGGGGCGGGWTTFDTYSSDFDSSCSSDSGDSSGCSSGDSGCGGGCGGCGGD
jgi:hypothetical protein